MSQAFIFTSVNRRYSSLLVCALVVATAWAQEPIESSVEKLIEQLKCADRSDRHSAAMELGRIGPDAKTAVSALIELLEDKDRYIRGIACVALGRIGPEAKSAVSALSETLKDEKGDVRRKAAKALGNIGPDAKGAVPALSEVLENKRSSLGRAAAKALGNIAQGLLDRNDNSSLPELEKALVALKTGEFPDEVIRPVRVAVRGLAGMGSSDNNLSRLARKYPWISGIAIVEVGLFAIWIVLLVFSPLTLLNINEGLDGFFNEKMRVRYGAFEGSAPVKFVLLVGFFQYLRRVLDSWVDKHVGAVRKNFEEMETVALRQTHVSTPIVLDGSSIPSIGPELLRQTCQKRRWRVLIHGEGGAGKTSLACQMAHWAMADDKAKRLCDHRMLPTLIEQEIDLTVENARHRFRETIRGQLQDLVGEEETVSLGLLDHLLRKQRVLVIVDHFSEMSEETRQAVRPGHAEFLPSALVVTSRLDEKLDGVRKTTIRPHRIDGNRLSSFMESYLTQIGKRELFDDPEYFRACGKLSEMVAERDITVLLAKLYADQMVSIKEGADDSTLPGNIPDLMLRYIKILNRDRSADEPDNPTVTKVAKILAWECLRRTYRPATALREDIQCSINRMDQEVEHLKHLETRLRVIRSAGAGDESVLFELDPLAEYLAGLHLVEIYGGTKECWREFFSQADAQEGAPESIKGFLLAVRDCCLAKKKQGRCDIPDFVVEELDKRAGLDPEVLSQARLQQRVKCLISDLSKPYKDDRWNGVQGLGRIGPHAKAAVPALIEVLEDESEAVQWKAIEALGRIGPGAKAAVPALLQILQNESGSLRSRAIDPLVSIAPQNDRLFPALIDVLKQASTDPERNHVARVLTEHWPKSQIDEALKDVSAEQHWRIAERPFLHQPWKNPPNQPDK